MCDRQPLAEISRLFLLSRFSTAALPFHRMQTTFFMSVVQLPSVLGTLYQVPSLGGESRKVANRLASPVAFSPDGTRLAFVRDNPGEETALVVIKTDGSEERQLAARKIPDPFAVSEASPGLPDGKSIAIGAYSGGECYVTTVRVADGSVKQVGSKGWRHILRAWSWLWQIRTGSFWELKIQRTGHCNCGALLP